MNPVFLKIAFGWLVVTLMNAVIRVLIPFVIIAGVWFIEVQTGFIGSLIIAVLDGAFSALGSAMGETGDLTGLDDTNTLIGTLPSTMVAAFLVARLDECLAILLSAYGLRVLLNLSGLRRIL